MNPQRDTLSEALRELAAASPEVSPELGARLSSAFARHHSQRRLRQRVAVVVALAACVAISAYWLRPHRASESANVVAPAAQTAQIPQVSVEPKDANVGHASPEPKIAAPESPKLSRSVDRTRGGEAAGSAETKSRNRATMQSNRPQQTRRETSSRCQPSIRRFRWAVRGWCAWICPARRCNSSAIPSMDSCLTAALSPMSWLARTECLTQ